MKWLLRMWDARQQTTSATCAALWAGTVQLLQLFLCWSRVFVWWRTITVMVCAHSCVLQAETKALELRCARRIQHRQQLVGLCITTTQPALYWRPRETSKESLPLLQEADAAFESWKQQQLQELEAERAELVQAAAARREAALARPAARQHPATGDAAGDGAGDGAAGTGGNTCGDEGAGEDGAAILGDSQQQQYLGDEEQQQRQDDEGMQEAAGDDAEEQQEEEQPRVGRFRNRGSDDEDEERLLSSDDEDA
jgi:hypothetical protein